MTILYLVMTTSFMPNVVIILNVMITSLIRKDYAEYDDDVIYLECNDYVEDDDDVI